MYNFDKPTERRNTNCMKWDEPHPALTASSSEEGQHDLIPLWVADMDFEAAPCIIEALRRRIEHGVFGYSFVPESYYHAVIDWFQRRHRWTISREWMLYTSGVVPAISATLKALTMPGERVLVLTPVYNCFFSSIRNNGCEVLCSPLVVRNAGVQECRSADNTLQEKNPQKHSSELLHFYTPTLLTYEVDWQDFETKCADEKTTVFLLCNPHNPAGRVWTREELQRMADICHRHHVRVVSDEIHCELVMPGHTFVPFGTIESFSVICNSPSKSFNTAGLQIANIICTDAETRRRIDRAININETCDVNPFGPVALEAAYNEGEAWIDELNGYLWGNYLALKEFFAEHLPQLKVFQLEGTYLVWIDITATGLSADALEELILREARVWVNSGTMYGSEGFIRINIATQRARLMEGLQRIASVMSKE